MPSLTKFVHELRTEEKFGSEAVEHIDDRVHELNDSQLIGMVSYLKQTVPLAESRLWQYAIDRVLGSADTELGKRQAQWKEEKAIQDEINQRLMEQLRAERAKVEHKRRERELVELRANQKAETEVKEGERRRKHQEKITLIKKQQKATRVKKRYYGLAGCILISGIVFFFQGTPLYWILSGVCVLLMLLLARRGWRKGQVHPVIVTDEELEELIAERRALIMRTAIIEQKRREREKKEAEKRERREMRSLRHARREKRRVEQEKLQKLKDEGLIPVDEKKNSALASLATGKQPNNGMGCENAASLLDSIKAQLESLVCLKEEEISDTGGGDETGKHMLKESAGALVKAEGKAGAAVAAETTADHSGSGNGGDNCGTHAAAPSVQEETAPSTFVGEAPSLAATLIARQNKVENPDNLTTPLTAQNGANCTAMAGLPSAQEKIGGGLSALLIAQGQGPPRNLVAGEKSAFSATLIAKGQESHGAPLPPLQNAEGYPSKLERDDASTRSDSHSVTLATFLTEKCETVSSGLPEDDGEQRLQQLQRLGRPWTTDELSSRNIVNHSSPPKQKPTANTWIAEPFSQPQPHSPFFSHFLKGQRVGTVACANESTGTSERPQTVPVRRIINL